MQAFDGLFDVKIIVGNERLDAVVFAKGADIAGELAVVTAKAADLEAHFFFCDAGGGFDVGAVTENKDTLAGEVC